MQKLSYTELVKELERIVTIDGRGRPWKAARLLELIKSQEQCIIESVLEEISNRNGY